MDGWKLEGDFPFVGAYFLGAMLVLERVILLMIEILKIRKAAMVALKLIRLF